MATPPKGQADYLALGDWNANCAVCGRKFKASSMTRQPAGAGTPWASAMYVCQSCYRPRQPQDFVRGIAEKMAAPWVQNDRNIYGLGTVNITDDEDADVHITTEDSGTDGIIITVQPGLVLTITIDSGVTGTVLINNFGSTVILVNNSAATVTIQDYAGSTTEALTFVVTSANFDVDKYGYSTSASPDQGSILPATLLGYTIYDFYVDVTTPFTRFQVVGTVAQDTFTSLSDGTTTLTSASATFSQFGPYTRWVWADDFWGAATGAIPVSINP